MASLHGAGWLRHGGRSASHRGALRSALSLSAGYTESLILAVRRRIDGLGAPVCAVALQVQWARETAAAVSIRSQNRTEQNRLFYSHGFDEFA